jgi:rhodanese-related sulfurtransferase
MKRVSPTEAKALLDEGWTYVDVRSEPEFDQGHPTGALNIPLLRATPAGMIPNQDFVKVMQAVLQRQTKIVVGCQSGGRSMRAAAMLEAAGYQNIADQRAGFGGAFDASGRMVEPGWKAQNLPVESGQPPGRSYADLLLEIHG